MTTVTFDGDTIATNGREGVSGFSISHSRATQVSDLVRSDYPFMDDRGNRTAEISFSVYKEHSDVATAEIYMLEHEASLSGQGDLVFTIGTEVRQFDDALLVGLQLQQMGLTTIAAYQFRASYAYEPTP